MKILVLDDDRFCCDDLADFLSRFPHEIHRCYDSRLALETVRKNKFDLIISDVNMPYLSGLEFLERLREERVFPEVILISGKEDVIESINAFELGIFDFLNKPVDIFELSELIVQVDKKMAESAPFLGQNMAELLKNREYLVLGELFMESLYSFSHENMGDIGIFSEDVFLIFKKMKKIQDYPEIPILIEGETGTGKEVMAKYLHYTNPRLSGPFVGINCSTLTPELFNTELFGYAGGAFTGADPRGKTGKLQLAEQGTLFLDEISELPWELQAKLLRVVQEREYYPVAGNKKQRVGARIVCASNKDLEVMVAKGFFREDLYHRLNICKVKLPALRDKKAEIIPLALFLLHKLSLKLNRPIEKIATRGLRLLEDYSWPGNIREMKNMLTQLLVFKEGSIMEAEEIAYHLPRAGALQALATKITEFSLPDESFSLEELNRRIIRLTLEKFQGNKSKAASFLGLTRIQMYRRFKLEEGE